MNSKPAGRRLERPVKRSARLVVLASGEGSNLQAVLDACSSPDFGASVAAVFSDKPAARALERARLAGVRAVPFPCAASLPRAEYDAALADSVAAHEPDFVLLLGWMRLLSDAFLRRFPGLVVNLHPALPGAFPGTRAVERALSAYRSGAILKTGVMTHLVPDEGVDSGPVLMLEEVPIEFSDTLEMLEARVHDAEHRLIVKTVTCLVSRHATERSTPFPQR